MLLSSCFVCIGQLFWKLTNSSGYVYLMAGFIFYIIGSLLMIKAYHYGELNILQPLLSTGYVVSLILGAFILGETVNVFNVLGVLSIILGVIFIISGDHK